MNPVSSLQDIAAEQSTMAYRAPELFDVKTGVTIDEKVDIWVSARVLILLALRRSIAPSSMRFLSILPLTAHWI